MGFGKQLDPMYLTQSLTYQDSAKVSAIVFSSCCFHCVGINSLRTLDLIEISLQYVEIEYTFWMVILNQNEY